MRLEPTFDNVVIERDKAAERSAGGILLPEPAKDKPCRGTVLAVGPGRYQNGVFVDTVLQEGDVVLFGAYAGKEIDLDDKKKVLVMSETEIIAVERE